jgi:hypothetical protein
MGHTFRFLNQTLNWTTPRIRHPERAGCWALLAVATYTQSRLAHAIVTDRRLPWERPQRTAKLLFCRVQQTV